MSVLANENATMLFQSLVRETFSTKLVAEKHKLTEEVSCDDVNFKVWLSTKNDDHFYPEYDFLVRFFFA